MVRVTDVMISDEKDEMGCNVTQTGDSSCTV